MGRSSKKGQKVEEPSVPPVILRWQDLSLSDLHENELIMMAPEDYPPPRGKGKGEGKAHAELKEMLKEDRSKFGTCRLGCHICLKRDHWSITCPYQLVYISSGPGAPVGPFAEIVCLCCGEEKPHPGEPVVDWKARAILKISSTYPSFDSYAADGASV